MLRVESVSKRFRGGNYGVRNGHARRARFLLRAFGRGNRRGAVLPRSRSASQLVESRASRAGVAQLVESELPKLKVAGSIPVARSKLFVHRVNRVVLVSGEGAECTGKKARSRLSRLQHDCDDGSALSAVRFFHRRYRCFPTALLR